ncbi:unnamed protein product [Closterium sp. NIES-64]|nr:unnamed protein product [Closterium sp. NIES-64]
MAGLAVAFLLLLPLLPSEAFERQRVLRQEQRRRQQQVTGPCSPLETAKVIRIKSYADVAKRLNFAPTQTVMLVLLPPGFIASTGLLFDGNYSCTILRSKKPAQRSYIKLTNALQPVLRIWNTHNVIVMDVNFYLPVKSSSRLCSFTEVGKGMLCPAIHIWRSYGVQVAKGEVFGRIDVFRSMQARGEVFGRIDVFRSMQARVDGMSVTATYRFVNSPGVIRIGESGYGPELVRANIVISNNEAYGEWWRVVCPLSVASTLCCIGESRYGPELVRSNIVISNNEAYGERCGHTPVVMHWGAVGVAGVNNFVHDLGVDTPIVMHLGAVGVTVINNFVHSFRFAGVDTPIVMHLGAVGVTVINNFVYDFGFAGVDTPIVMYLGAMGVTVINNFVHDFGLGSHTPTHLPVLISSPPSGVDTPIVMHWGAVGVTVVNNFIHDFGFAGIRCGADVHFVGDCMLTNISNNIVYNWRRNSSGDVDSAGIYYCTHWFSPGNVAECNYIVGGDHCYCLDYVTPGNVAECNYMAGGDHCYYLDYVTSGCNYVAGGDHCYYLDYVTSGVVIRGGACINTYDGIKVNNGKLNVIKHVILKNVEGMPGWCTCLTPTVNNCRKGPGTYWEKMRLKYYDTELFRKLWSTLPRKGGGSVKVGKGGKAAKGRGGSGGRNGGEGGEKNFDAGETHSSVSSLPLPLPSNPPGQASVSASRARLGGRQ